MSAPSSVSALVILLLVPFQAAAEEYVFRGILMQSLGAWVRWAPLAIVLPTVLFAFGHIYDIWGLLDVAAFGLAAAWITWRTGGLEAGIVMHTVNNVVLFLLLASGVLGRDRGHPGWRQPDRARDHDRHDGRLRVLDRPTRDTARSRAATRIGSADASRFPSGLEPREGQMRHLPCEKTLR